MAIICLIICNSNGEILLARQFVPLFSKKEIFTQCSIFIQNYTSNKQINYLDIYSYRYLYQFLNDNFILLLITILNNSNIILEQETLKLCHRLIQQRLGININKEIIKSEGLNLVTDLDEVIQNGMIQNLNLGEVNTRINNIRVDKEEIKKKFEEKKIKQKNIMIKQFEEMEKLEELEKNNKNENIFNSNFEENRNNNDTNNQTKNYNNMIHNNIKLNYKFEIVKINKPIVFKTPSGKVVLLTEQKKVEDSRKDKKIKGIKLGNH